MSDNLRVSMRLDGNGKPLVEVLDKAEAALVDLGTTATKAGAQASTGLTAVTKAAGETAQQAAAAGKAVADLGTKAAAASTGLQKASTELAEVSTAAAGVKAQAAGAAAGVQQVGAAAAAAGQAAGAAAPHVGKFSAGAGAAGAAGHKAAEGIAAAGKAAGVTQKQFQQLTPQLNDIFTSLVGGMPLYMIAAQQGPQITQVFGSMKATASAFAASARAAITPTNLLIAGGLTLAAGATTLALSAERQQRALNSLSGQLRVTRNDYAGLAADVTAVGRKMGETTSLGTADATSAAASIAGTPQFSGQRAELEELVVLAGRLSKAYDTTVPAAAEKFIVKALKDPAAAARELADGGLRTMTAALEEQVRRLAATGREAEATRLVFNALKQNFGEAAEGGTLLERSINRVEQALTRMWNAATKDNSFLPWLANGVASFMEAGERASTVLDQVRTQRRTSGLTGSATQASADMQPHLAAASSASGVDPELLARVLLNEGVRNADGTWKVSSAGARGGMQVMPGTFAEMARKYGITGGIDDDAANTMAGARYFRELLDKYGDPRAAAAAYNAGPGRYDESRRPDGRMLPNETIAYAARVTSGYGGSGRALPPALIPQDGGDLVLRGATSTSQAALPAARTEGQNAALRIALAEARDIDPTTTDRRRLSEQQQRLQAARAMPGLSPDETEALDRAIARIGVTAAATRDPIEALVKGMRDTGEMAGVTEGPLRELAEANERLQQAEEAAGRSATGSERLAVQDAVLMGLSGRYKTVAEDMDRQIAGQERMAEAVGRGNDAVREAEAREKALGEARRLAVEGTPRHLAMVEALTARNLRLADSSTLVASRQALVEQGRTAEMTALQRRLVGGGAMENASAIAGLRARQDLERQRRPTTGPEAEAYLRNARQQAVNDLDLQREQAAFDELGNAVSNSFDRITGSMTTMALEGKASFGDLKNMGMAVANELAAEFARLALINPLKNAIFGSNSGTLTDVAGKWLGSYFTGGGGTGTGVDPSVVSGVYHTGGRMGLEPTAYREVPAGLFAAAPRFHNGRMGSLGAGEIPAIIRDDESVLTPGQMAALGPAGGTSIGGLTVNFNGTTGTAEERRAMAQEMRAMIYEKMAEATPHIVAQARADSITQAGRGGSYARAVGRR